jgi:hypothetical protein
MKRIHIFSAAAFAAVIFLYPLFTNAQQTVPIIQWSKCYGGSSYDEAKSIQQTRDGGYVIGGSSSSNDGDVMGHHNVNLNYDYWIVKLDPMCDLEWERSLGGSNSEMAQSIQQTMDGGYIVAGWTLSNDGDVSGLHTVAEDYWVVKLDSLGNIQWQKCLGGSSTDEASCVEQTRDSGYIIAGSSGSTDGDVTGHHAAAGPYDYWVVILTKSGSIQWEHSYGGTNLDEATCVRQTSDDGYIVGGITLSTDGDVTGFHGVSTTNWDCWIVKIDSIGNTLWEKCYGGSKADLMRDMRETSDGGYIVSGYSMSNDGDVTGHHGSTDSLDCWIVKLDGLGNIQWEKSLGSDGNDEALDAWQTSDHGYIISAMTDSSFTGGKYNGGHSAWIIKMDSTGNIQWQNRYGGSSGEMPYSIQQTSDSGYIFAGSSSSTDGDVKGNHGQSDVWAVKLFYPPVISSLTKQNFSPLMCGAQEPDTLYIHNIGKSTLTISSAGFGGNANYSLVSPSSFPVNIAPGDSLRSIVLFTSSAIGTFPGTLSIVNNDQVTGHSPWQIGFTGTKDSISVRVNRVKNDRLDLGAIVAGAMKDSTFTIINTSTTATTFLVRTRDAIFPVDSSLSLSFNTSGTVKVHFIGETVPGRYIDSLIITDTCGRTQTVYLAVTVKSGIPAGIQITNPIDAGYVHINTQKTVPFSIKNTTASSITIDSMTLIGTNAQYYQLKNVPQLPFTIAAGNTQTMNVTFSPINAGTQDATLEITTSLSSSALVIPVDGIGTRSVLTANALNFDTLSVSTCKTDTMKVTNVGNYPLLISQIGILGVYAGDYTVLTTVNDTLHPGDTADIAIKYCPTASGEEDVVAELITSDGDTLFVNIYGGGASAVQEILPSSTTLSQNYPNPFSTSTNIEVRIPNAGAATLKVYNVLGVEVADLTQELRRNNDVTFTANGLQAGVYFYTLETATRQLTRQMFVVR